MSAKEWVKSSEIFLKIALIMNIIIIKNRIDDKHASLIFLKGKIKLI